VSGLELVSALHTPRLSRRQVLIGAASSLLLTAAVLGAAVLMKHSGVLSGAAAPAPTTRPARPRLPSESGPKAAAAPAGVRSTRVAGSSLTAALFSPHSWHVEPPPPPPAPVAPAGPPPAPTAPPLPFTFVGSYALDGDQATFFITRGDRIYSVKPGDEVDSDYTLVAVDGANMIFNYKPLNARQSLALGEGK
jgi:hypothetical protein